MCTIATCNLMLLIDPLTELALDYCRRLFQSLRVGAKIRKDPLLVRRSTGHICGETGARNVCAMSLCALVRIWAQARTDFCVCAEAKRRPKVLRRQSAASGRTHAQTSFVASVLLCVSVRPSVCLPVYVNASWTYKQQQVEAALSSAPMSLADKSDGSEQMR